MSIRAGSVMTLKNATVYWKYRNVTTDVNDYILYGSSTSVDDSSTKIKFEEGYWTFDMIKEKLKLQNVILTRSVHDNKCNILSKGHYLNLNKFGLLLGFRQDVIPSNILTKSPDVVDVNQGLRYISINCDAVNTLKSTNTDGKKSYIITSLPITTEQSLNGTRTFFSNVDSKVMIDNGGCSNRLVFNVTSNIKEPVDVDILLDLYIT